jgi:hypothetical protein
MYRLCGLRSLFLALTLLVFVVPALAHPGHGRDGGSHELTHYVTEPAHVGPVVLALVAGVAAAVFVIWYRRKA